MKIRLIRSKTPGLYIRKQIVYKSRWVKWVGLAALPIGKPWRRWVGIAIETRTDPPEDPPDYYKRRIMRTGRKYRVDYDPVTREPLGKGRHD